MPHETEEVELPHLTSFVHNKIKYQMLEVGKLFDDGLK
jgi:hypothetical protein